MHFIAQPLCATLFLAAAPPAHAQIRSHPLTFTVTSTADTPDAHPGDAVCDDGTGHCTLRAAIQESNANIWADTIQFNLPTTDPGYDPTTGTWTVNTSELPIFADRVTIAGPSAAKLKLRGSAPNRVFNVTASGTVSISGLTITGGSVTSGQVGGGLQNVTEPPSTSAIAYFT